MQHKWKTLGECLSFSYFSPTVVFIGYSVCFPLLLFTFRFYEEAEPERIRGAWRKWKNAATWLTNIRGMHQSEKLFHDR